MATEDQANQRRVRPWIAALLTFVGPGVGLFYARQTRAAIWVIALSIFIGVALVLALYAYVVATNSVPRAFADPANAWLIDLSGLAISALIAIGVWVFVARHQHVQKAGPLRLLGYVAIFLVPLLLQFGSAMALRVTLAQPFRAPSGSMQPTVNVGDYILVSKASYGYSRFSAAPFQNLLPHGAREPERGDIVVFRPVAEPDRDFVKRVIGLPGDRVQMIRGALFINGVPVTREGQGEQSIADPFGGSSSATLYRETLPNGVSYLTLGSW